MKNETLKNIILLIVTLIGGLLVGFNAGLMSNPLNTVLFIIGVVLISMSAMIMNFFTTDRKSKK